MICRSHQSAGTPPDRDGAAAVLLAPLDRFSRARGGPRCAWLAAPVRPTAWRSDRREPLRLRAAEASAARAYAMAGIAQDGIDSSSCTTPSPSCRRSRSRRAASRRPPGTRMALDGALRRRPAADPTHGGLKGARSSRGRDRRVSDCPRSCASSGARAGRNQLERAVTGMAQNVGGSGATIVTTILQTRN